MLITKLCIVLPSVALLTNIFIMCINNADRWLKIFSKMYIACPQMKYTVLVSRILYSVTPEHLASGQCSIHVVDQFQVRKRISKVH